MKEIPTAPPLPNAPSTQDFSKLGFVCITVLGLANQVVPHTGSWRLLATAINYLAWPASPVGVQPDSGMGCDTLLAPEVLAHVPTCTPWLLTGLVLMRLNAYFSQLSLVFSLLERLSQ
ncbi:hypothetical protein DSO57_1002072 [Entomophthora muscae]|uniref:Uncharacterized protein n=1 Tax=Entomophthora muscae TaxID=34485 RepID=A0ACC2S020_9FUNG|nr:hypothetical protein DSO57_1002072 [Entomophthora muscae]